MTNQSMVVLSGVSKRFQEGGGERAVLQGVDATIARGEFVAVRGRSGSGKTTLLNLIAGLDVPDAGEIYVDGQAVSEMSDRQRTLFRRRHLGFVFQFFNLIPTLTVRENLRFGLELNRMGEQQADAVIAGLLARLDLEDRADSFPDRLSGGEQQRVAIARALAHGPRLVLADEPTGNLDLETEAGVLELLDELPRRQGATLVVATHSNEIARRADRVLSLRDGRLTAA
jgi:putative ABC transport system ATP-binding protein